MAEIEITLPTVQYGNVKVRATAEELGLESIADSHALGVATAVYLNLFSQGFKHGATIDVTGPTAPSQPDPRDAVGDPTAAAVAAIQDGLGATEVAGDESTTAPWDAKPAAVTKPWEQKSDTKKPVVDSGW